MGTLQNPEFKARLASWWRLPPYLCERRRPLARKSGASRESGDDCLYCIRAVYLNKCVRNSWGTDWYCWYFLRPLTSFICGGASFLFLKTGLLTLESNIKENATEIGFYALAFVAGLNADKFVAKIEGVAHAVWGIEKSRSATASTDDKKTGEDNG